MNTRSIKLNDGDVGEKPMGFLVDLSAYTFDDVVEDAPTWIQAFPHGTYHHPVYGKIEMTPEKASIMASNVKNNVRGQDLDIDYDHKTQTSEAAGWVRDADARPDGLWLSVSWTKSALQKLKERAYRYFSPEFNDEWTHPATKTKHKHVLFGGALTNRPFLKGILPINLSEVIQANEGGNLVDRATMEKLAKRLGIQFDEKTSDEDLAKALSEVEEEAPKETDEEKVAREAAEAEAAKKKAEDEVVPALSEATLKQLAESNPAVALLLQEREQTAKRLAAVEAANRLSETNLKLNELQEKAKAKGYAIPPAVLTQARDLISSSPIKLGEDVHKMLSDLVDKGLVELGERGKGQGGSGNIVDATRKFNDAIEAKMKTDKLSYAEAASAVAAEDESLFQAYLTEQAEGVQL